MSTQLVDASALSSPAIDDMAAENITASRIPDLTGPIVLTATPTPRAQNIFETVTDIYEEQLSYSTYPNPVSDLLTIEVPTQARIKIINMQGTMVLSAELPGTDSISLSHLPTGLYVVSIITESGSVSKRIVKL